MSRTASPFLNAGANGSRSKSPLSENKESASPAPAAIRSATTVRKASSAGTAKKGSVLGAKKAPKLGAKKIGAAETIDFEEAERKAKEEAERVEKLGYDPEAEKAEAEAASASATTIASPTPISPSRGSIGSASKPQERSAGDVERLGMGIGRLGFGQTSKPPAPKKPGFGAVAPTRSREDGELLSFGCSITSLQNTNNVPQTRNWRKQEPGSATRRAFRPMNSLDGIALIPLHSRRPRSVSASSMVPRPFLATATSAGPKMIFRKLTMDTVTWKGQPEISSAGLELRPVMISKT